MKKIWQRVKHRLITERQYTRLLGSREANAAFDRSRHRAPPQGNHDEHGPDIPNQHPFPLLNKCEPPARVLAHAVPTRIIRLVQMDEAGLVFRVEQLIEHAGFSSANPKGEWKTLSTHGGKRPGEAMAPAFNAMLKAQQDLIYKLQKRMAVQMPRVIQ